MADKPRIPSPEEVEAACTLRGGWTKATLAGWGIPWPPPKGWRRDLQMAYLKSLETTPAEMQSFKRSPITPAVRQVCNSAREGCYYPECGCQLYPPFLAEVVVLLASDRAAMMLLRHEVEGQ